MMNMTMNMTQPQDALLCSTSPDLVFSIFDYICDSGSRLQVSEPLWGSVTEINNLGA